MPPQLKTSRLQLLPVERSHQAFIYKGLSHPDVIPFYGVRYDSFEATTEQMVWYEALHNTGTGTAWLIINVGTGQKMGVVSVYKYEAAHNKAETGFWLLPEYWGKGYVAEAMLAAIDYWMADKKLHRLEAFVEEENLASSRVLEKTGFAYEGTMRDCERKNGRYISLQIYALIL